MDRYQDRLIVCGCNSPTDNIVLFDTENHQVIKVFTHDEGEQDPNSSWPLHVSAVTWAHSGQWVFSASPCKGPGVVQWDVETGKSISEFNHRSKWDGKLEEGLYGPRDPNEIYGLCATKDGSMFVSGSYRYLYVWDTRSKELVNQIEFYEPPEKKSIEEVGDNSFKQSGNHKSPHPLQSIGFTNSSETLLTVIGRDNSSKVVTYEFPSMRPILESQPHFKEFEIRSELYSVSFDSPHYTVAVDINGTVLLWSNTERGEAVCITEKMLIGSGANGVSMSESEDIIASSMSNPQSGWFGATAAVFKVKDREKKKREQRCCTQ
eukprot:TRINITY_DN2312_c0_g1_i1.p1 TRINITY_DN2312_c0_g1~~TRINITY_DN2312_c0_g1_i1.p1  ORF type:complete len:320 (+),score=52.80 TRINITY_DN2312_c0_g1_i1:355-1314(+)